MDYRIWKYNLIFGIQTVMMPDGAQILSVGEQDGALRLWSLAEINQEKVERFIEVVCTGDTIPVDMGVDRDFIGTVNSLHRGTYETLHVFERK